MSDVLIVGGGLAGAAAAITLAKSGCDVTLIERESGPTDKVCGEFLSAEALGILAELGMDLAQLGAVPIRGVRLSWKGDVRESPLPFAARSLTRRTLDEAMLQHAEAAGATVLRGKPCTQLHRIGQRWQNTLGGSEWLSSSQVMLATGKHDLRGLPRSPGTQPDLIGFKMYWKLGDSQQQALGNHVELHLFPAGYAGLQAVENGVANLCCAVRSASLQGGAEARWRELLDRMRSHSALLAQRLEGAAPLLDKPLAIAPIPYGMVRAEAEDGLWRLGDQAAVIPSFTGDGMSIALWSGRLAASMLLAGESAQAFQHRLANAVESQVGFATSLSRVMVTGAGRFAADHMFQLWPGAMQTIARRTRLREASGTIINPAASSSAPG